MKSAWVWIAALIVVSAFVLLTGAGESFVPGGGGGSGRSGSGRGGGRIGGSGGRIGRGGGRIGGSVGGHHRPGWDGHRSGVYGGWGGSGGYSWNWWPYGWWPYSWYDTCVELPNGMITCDPYYYY